MNSQLLKPKAGEVRSGFSRHGGGQEVLEAFGALEFSLRKKRRNMVIFHGFWSVYP